MLEQLAFSGLRRDEFEILRKHMTQVKVYSRQVFLSSIIKIYYF